MQENNGGVGLHLFLDLHDVAAELLTDLEAIKKVLERAALATGATVLSTQGHHFGEGHGVTALIMLSESHASIHTWPERNLAVMDFFTCGACNPKLAIDVLTEYFKPNPIICDLVYRGVPVDKTGMPVAPVIAY